ARLLGERVIGGNSSDGRCGHHGFEGQLGRQDRTPEKANVDVMTEQRFDLLTWRHGMEHELHVRVISPSGAHDTGYALDRERPHETQIEPPALAALSLLRGSGRAFDLPKDGPGSLEERLAPFGELDMAARSLNQLHTKLGFQ